MACHSRPIQRVIDKPHIAKVFGEWEISGRPRGLRYGLSVRWRKARQYVTHRNDEDWLDENDPIRRENK